MTITDCSLIMDLGRDDHSGSSSPARADGVRFCPSAKAVTISIFYWYHTVKFRCDNKVSFLSGSMFKFRELAGSKAKFRKEK